jgi:phosphoenolpyruvate carboxykinase (GTP)
MMRSSLPGYKIWTVGDDIAWLNVGPDGQLWAINPEAGFFGVAPGTAEGTNPNMLSTLKTGTFFPTLFTNTAIDMDTNEPWWEGLTKTQPKNLRDWQGNQWDPALGTKAAHPNSRFTVSAKQCPTLSREFDNPQGVPISAIIFGCRRTQLIPLVFEANSWANGVFAGARMGSETTAAATAKVGSLRRDPMAMLPFCGYNMGEYFGHWLEIGKKLKKPPKIFSVNWFRTDDNGKFIWPGFGDNIRVLEWMIKRISGSVGGRQTPVGLLPQIQDLNLSNLDLSRENLEKILNVSKDGWDSELADIKKFLEQFGPQLPEEIWQEYKILEKNFK